MEFGKKIRPSQAKEWLGTDRVSVRSARGTSQQNIIYCSKQDPEPFTCGKPAVSGSTGKLTEIAEAISAGAGLQDIVRSHPTMVILHGRGIRDLLALSARNPRRTEPRRIVVRTGKPGSGKTSKCYDEFPDLYHMARPNGHGVYFDSYTNEKAILLDDFYGWIPYDLLL